MKRSVLIFAILVLGGILLMIIDYIEKETPIKMRVSVEGSVFKNAQFIQKKNNQLKLSVTSEEAFISDDGKLIELKSLKMFFPEKEFTVKAKKGFYYTESGDFILSEEITGFSKDCTVYGTEAYWNAKDNTLYSEKPLKIEGKRFYIEGNTGRANAELIELKKGVMAVVYPKS
uniref:LPS export ABC transporter periplasmic protein LptC n=1 Tax=Thermodesulfovibrio aggregans TaxID=86166 RepID=A0A7C4AJ50_9BACT